jgi:hypothetical protein
LFLATAVAALAQQPTGRLVVEPTQSTYYVGQAVRLVVEVDVTDGELAGDLQLSGMPEATWARNDSFREVAGKTRTDGGRLVTTKRFASALRLLRPGRHSLAPVLGGQTVERMRSGFVTRLFQRSFQLAFPPLTMDVAALPEPTPTNFCGAVGRFTLTAQATPANVSPGDLVTLRWQLDGFGNLDVLRLPAIDAVPQFRVYPPKEESREDGTRVVVSQVFVPQSLGAALLPALAVHTFNPETGRYEQLAAGPFALTVTPRSAAAPPPTPAPALTPSVAAPTPAAGGVPTPWRVPAPSVTEPLLVLLGGVALAITVFSAAAGRSRWLAALLASATLAAAFGIRQALLAHRQRGILTLSVAAESRLCPSTTAKPLATLPAGATVRILEQTERWLRVEHDGASGWIPEPAVAEALELRQRR